MDEHSSFPAISPFGELLTQFALADDARRPELFKQITLQIRRPHEEDYARELVRVIIEQNQIPAKDKRDLARLLSGELESKGMTGASFRELFELLVVLRIRIKSSEVSILTNGFRDNGMSEGLLESKLRHMRPQQQISELIQASDVPGADMLELLRLMSELPVEQRSEAERRKIRDAGYFFSNKVAITATEFKEIFSTQMAPSRHHEEMRSC